MSSRGIGRISAIGLLAAGTIGLVPAPAFAAGTDFGVDLTGVSLAAGSPVKMATLTITNHGTTVPATVDVRFDTTDLDASKVTMAEPDAQCRTDDDITTCRLTAGEIPGPGRSVKLPVVMRKLAGAGGAAGRLTVTVTAAGDTRSADNSRTVDVTVADSRVDLSVVAEDVALVGEEEDELTRPIPPGGIGTLFAVVINQGDTTAAGIKVDVTLPERSTVAGPVDGCEASADRRSLTCVLDQATLAPFTEAAQTEEAALFFTAPVRVARDAAGPVSLPGGVISAIALGHDRGARRARAADELPDSFSRPTAAEMAAIDADPTDNTDRFAVLVAGPADGGQVDGGPAVGGPAVGGPAAGGPAAGGQAGGAVDGGLPVTGPALPVIGAGGFAVAALGVLLYVLSRRRRVRLVAPGDGR